MAFKYSRKDVDSLARVLVQQLNELHDTVTSGTYKHRDQSALATGTYPFVSSSLLQVTATGSATSNVAEICALANDIRGVMAAHLGDDRAHKQADPYGKGGFTLNASSALFITGAIDQTTAFNLLNFLSGAYASHQSSSVYHQSADTRILSGILQNNTTAMGGFAASMKSTLNAHIFDGPLCGGIKLID